MGNTLDSKRSALGTTKKAAVGGCLDASQEIRLVESEASNDWEHILCEHQCNASTNPACDADDACGSGEKMTCPDNLYAIFKIVSHMCPVPDEAWASRKEFSCCMQCKKSLRYDLLRLYSNCRKCGKLLCRPCSKKRFRFPLHASYPLVVCRVCLDELLKLDDLLNKELSVVGSDFSRTDLDSICVADPSQIVKTLCERRQVLSVANVVRHPVAEAVKASAFGAETGFAQFSKTGAQLLFSIGTVEMAALASAVVVVPVQTAFTGYEVSKLHRRFKNGFLEKSEYDFRIATETVKGIASSAGAISGSVIGCLVGSAIPGAGTVVGLLLGGFFGALTSFAAGSTSHLAMLSVYSRRCRRRMLSRPTVDTMNGRLDALNHFVQSQALWQEFMLSIRSKPLASKLDFQLRSFVAILKNPLYDLSLKEIDAELCRIFLLLDELADNSVHPLDDSSESLSIDACCANSCSLPCSNLQLATNVDATAFCRNSPSHMKQTLINCYSHLLFRCVFLNVKANDARLERIIESHRRWNISGGLQALLKDAEFMKIAQCFAVPSDRCLQQLKFIENRLDKFSNSPNISVQSDCLTDIVRCCGDLLQQNGVPAPDSDDLANALVYVILTFRPKLMYSNVAFLEQFLTDFYGANAFALSTVCSALHFIVHGK